MPVLEREEYIEQAYFFHAFRERLIDGLPSQDILSRIGEELLSTTRLPLAVSFLSTDIKGSGVMAPAMARIGHYFTPFQTHVVDQAEQDAQPLRDGASPTGPGAGGEVQGGEPIPAGAVRLPVRGPVAQPARLYEGPGGDGGRPLLHRGLAGLHPDAPQPARRRRLRRPDLRALRVFRERAKQLNPEFIPKFPTLFGEKEGKIARANRGRDPMYLFSALQRQLGYPEVPRPRRPDELEARVLLLEQKIAQLENRLKAAESDLQQDDASPRCWSSPRIPRASRPDGVSHRR